MSNQKKISITVVVSGQPTVVDVSEGAPLGAVIPDALHQTENSGQPAGELGAPRCRWQPSRPEQEDRGLRLWEKDSSLPEPEGRGWGSWIERPNSM